MAIIETSNRTSPLHQVAPLLVSALLAGAAVLAHLAPAAAPVRWASLLLVPVAGWLGVGTIRRSGRQRARQAIRKHLSRLPDDFTILDDLVIQAPWGLRQIDHVILSRYGVIIASAGLPSGSMVEQVEAVRTLLFAARIMGSAFPIRPLILLPPGAPPVTSYVEANVPVVPVERLRLEHLAPGGRPLLDAHQVHRITDCLRP